MQSRAELEQKQGHMERQTRHRDTTLRDDYGESWQINKPAEMRFSKFLFLFGPYGTLGLIVRRFSISVLGKLLDAAFQDLGWIWGVTLGAFCGDSFDRAAFVKTMLHLHANLNLDGQGVYKIMLFMLVWRCFWNRCFVLFFVNLGCICFSIWGVVWTTLGTRMEHLWTLFPPIPPLRSHLH